ncbi:unnamed protein product [Acanthosepion pharaonis]|uniref:Uncharacterized protein n=1 Tax=Acanthosepion pharaonis TaxID=158019 RepID=A0A812DHS2_ACAPH|nr:unnamed protein product [Sepia pharaonis]
MSPIGPGLGTSPFDRKFFGAFQPAPGPKNETGDGNCPGDVTLYGPRDSGPVRDGIYKAPLFIRAPPGKNANRDGGRITQYVPLLDGPGRGSISETGAPPSAPTGPTEKTQRPGGEEIERMSAICSAPECVDRFYRGAPLFPRTPQKRKPGDGGRIDANGCPPFRPSQDQCVDSKFLRRAAFSPQPPRKTQSR